MSTILVLIDLQKDYFPGGAMELVASELAVRRAALLLKAYRQRSRQVIHVQHIGTHDGATYFLPGSPGIDIHPSVDPSSSERVIQKNFPNAFRETGLLESLRNQKATHLVFAGMMTHMCVDSTVRAASDLGFECSLAFDACATTHLTFGERIVDAKDVQAAYLSALADGFATLETAEELCTGL
jgi:nicotinamidase-related amidase